MIRKRDRKTPVRVGEMHTDRKIHSHSDDRIASFHTGSYSALLAEN